MQPSRSPPSHLDPRTPVHVQSAESRCTDPGEGLEALIRDTQVAVQTATHPHVKAPAATPSPSHPCALTSDSPDGRCCGPEPGLPHLSHAHTCHLALSLNHTAHTESEACGRHVPGEVEDAQVGAFRHGCQPLVCQMLPSPRPNLGIRIRPRAPSATFHSSQPPPAPRRYPTSPNRAGTELQ